MPRDDSVPRTKLDEDLAMELAETTDLSPNQALQLIQRYGNDRAKLMEAAKNFKAES